MKEQRVMSYRFIVFYEIFGFGPLGLKWAESNTFFIQIKREKLIITFVQVDPFFPYLSLSIEAGDTL